MSRYSPVLIVSLVCASGVAACGGGDSDVVSNTTLVESSSTDRVTTTAVAATTDRATTTEVAATTEPARTTDPVPAASVSVSAAQLVDESARALDEGDWAEAAAKATEAIELEPDAEILARAYANRAVAYAYLGRSNESVDDATRAIELKPEVPVAALALVARAFAHTGMGQLDDAVADATTALDLEPVDARILAWAYSTRGGALNVQGRGEDAVVDTTKAITLLDPEDRRILAEALVIRSSAYQVLGRLDDALADITAAIDLELDDERMLVAMHFFRALTLRDMGRLDDVVADATAVIELEPLPGVLAQTLLLRAEAFAELGRLDDAATDLDLAISASPYAEVEVRQLRDKYGIADPAPVDHLEELATGETLLLTQHLVEVDGYTYVDVGTEELDWYVTAIRDYHADIGVDLVVGASWHSVVADDPAQNTTGFEVGLLELFQRNASSSQDVLFDFVRMHAIGGEPIAELDIADVTVAVFEDPLARDSRYFYTWTIDNVTAVFDGADRESLERWLTAYLEELTKDIR